MVMVYAHRLISSARFMHAYTIVALLVYVRTSAFLSVWPLSIQHGPKTETTTFRARFS